MICLALVLEDFRAVQELLVWIAETLESETSVISEKPHKLFSILSASGPCRIILPINEGLLYPVKSLWQVPAVISPPAKHVEKRYQVPFVGFEYFYTRTLAPLVISTILKKSKSNEYAKDKDSKFLNLSGRKSYSSALLLLQL